jgi:hypothetical protein
MVRVNNNAASDRMNKHGRSHSRVSGRTCSEKSHFWNEPRNGKGELLQSSTMVLAANCACASSSFRGLYLLLLIVLVRPLVFVALLLLLLLA